MFAVIKTGGKQYKVASGDILTIERLAASAGDTVQFNDILMLGGDSPAVGDPLISGAAVQAEVVEQGRGEKVYNFKKRRRKHSSKRLKGHRQYLTTVKVTEILASGADATGVKAALGAASAGAMAAVVEAADPKPVAVAKSEDAPAQSAPHPNPAPEVIAGAAPTDAAPADDALADDLGMGSGHETAATETERPSNLLDAAQGEADDLTQISGVGPKLNTKLNENGVYHFWQIAEWGAAEVAFMDDQLSFKGRIDRDNWIEQAKTLAAAAKEG